MQAANNKIIVKCDVHQKDYLKVGETVIHTRLTSESNYRYRSPTICEVVNGNQVVKSGDILLVHHNLLYLPSPYHLGGDLFSIPFSKVLFAKLASDGSLDPICGNLICEEIEVETDIYLPPELRKMHKNAYRVVLGGWSEFKPGQIVLTRPSSGYSIIYNVGGEERTAVKVDSEMICGYLKPESRPK